MATKETIYPADVGKRVQRCVKKGMDKVGLVKCPHCNGRGMIGFSIRTEDGIAFFDFECDFCKGRGWVSKKRAEKYEKEKAEKENKKAEEKD